MRFCEPRQRVDVEFALITPLASLLTLVYLAATLTVAIVAFGGWSKTYVPMLLLASPSFNFKSRLGPNHSLVAVRRAPHAERSSRRTSSSSRTTPSSTPSTSTSPRWGLRASWTGSPPGPGTRNASVVKGKSHTASLPSTLVMLFVACLSCLLLVQGNGQRCLPSLRFSKTLNGIS